MPDREVKTLRHLLYDPYARVIARRAFDQADGQAALAERRSPGV